MGIALFRSKYNSYEIPQGEVLTKKPPAYTSLPRGLHVQVQETKWSVLPLFTFYLISSLEPTTHQYFDGLQKNT